MYLSRKFFSRNADKSLSPFLLNQYRMDRLSGRARRYWYDQRRSLKIYEPRGVHVTTGTSHTWCINTRTRRRHGTFVDVLLNLRTLREPLCCRCNGYTFRRTGRPRLLGVFKGNVKSRKTSREEERGMRETYEYSL